ncbi:MAG: hypothetical protein WAX69_11760 [Victivallales bacterium]
MDNRLKDGKDAFGSKVKNIIIDGKTTKGNWALMTEDSYIKYGVGIGLGVGRMYQRRHGKWVEMDYEVDNRLKDGRDDFGSKIKNIIIEGKTIKGNWALMTENSYIKHGVGIGLGVGKMYQRQDGKWVEMSYKLTDRTLTQIILMRAVIILIILFILASILMPCFL